jgi:hypothetical protein
MISKPSAAWRMLQRVLDNLLPDLNDDDLSDLFMLIERERARRFVISQSQPWCPGCGFVLCDCWPE